MRLLHRHDNDRVDDLDRRDADRTDTYRYDTGPHDGGLRDREDGWRGADRDVDAVGTIPARDRPAARRAGSGADAAHDRFGGVDAPASIVGTLAGLGTLALVGILVATIGKVAFDGGASDDGMTIGMVVAGLVALLIAFFVGGWTTGRVARYDGARNGLLSGFWFILLTAGLAAIGAWLVESFDVFDDLDLPSWFAGGSLGDDTAAIIVVSAIAAAAVLIGGILGGLVGARYHRRADAVVDGTTPLDHEGRDRDRNHVGDSPRDIDDGDDLNRDRDRDREGLQNRDIDLRDEREVPGRHATAGNGPPQRPGDPT